MNKTLIIIILSILSGCGPSYHLKRMKYHERMAYAKGAEIKLDTVYKYIPIITPERQIDTVHHYVNLTDTITVTKDRVVTKIKVNTEEKTVYVNTNCPSDTIYKEVPITITKNIEAKNGLPWWVYFALGLSGLIILVLAFRR